MRIRIISALIVILIGLCAGVFVLMHKRGVASGIDGLDKILNHKGVTLNRDPSTTRYVLLNFWASWCPPCIEEMPSLIAFAQAHREFLFVSISQDSSKKEFTTYLNAFPDLAKKSDALFMDEDKSAGLAYHVEQLPETYIFDLKTRSTLKIPGAIDWSKPEVLSQIENGLKTPGPK